MSLSPLFCCFSYVPFQLYSYSSFNRANLFAFSISICPNNREVGTHPWAAVCLPLICCVFALSPTAGLQVLCTPAHLTFHPGGLSSRDLCPAAEGPPRSHPEASSLVVRANVCLTKSELYFRALRFPSWPPVCFAVAVLGSCWGF